MIIFSFSLYGSNPKYTLGMIRNAEWIPKRFPQSRVQIYLADDVPSDICDRLRSLPSVKIIPVSRKIGIQPMFDRFLAIDDEDCSIMFSRDADSRVHERDAGCIEDFIASHKMLHIIRDHHYHSMEIMGGLFGIRKGALKHKIENII